ncbi:NAD(P) transhydrogenase subunit alpha [Zymomonas mobilis]|uniref:NAD(P) transhydrogenase subunit alpha n=1 Tax=Zymomonas mobilis TaxID=542 RepID=UPI0011683764|nr:NAD(P) transhydrogenase subunit alpha [Zymomonas mobilis]MDX5949584.1 NAD(P) transhydrogenase subunit alpha [Zymomonas mobilis subsp. pomaceae]GEB90031.1 putative NAD(P) transhydrogenase, alpha1 subunit PntAA [Zymomonas mobilis subsp. pomaceae]
MAIKISVLKENKSGEKRVAVIPLVASKILLLGASLALEAGAGEAATFPDSAYKDVDIIADLKDLIADADIILAVEPPSIEIIKLMKVGTILISFIYGTNSPELLAALQSYKITTFAMEQIPRISRAQTMDALSSQAALAGYYAPLLGAVHIPRILPMMTTAVGSLRAAKVLVMGLGVAGLSALATAKRLGAITEGYDVRPETKEQAQSLGAKFVDTGIDARSEGGYARELTTDEKIEVQKVLSQHIANADMIITTAAVPGKPAPKLISAEQVTLMKSGSVIVDLGAEGGGNCEGTKSGEIVKIGPTTIIGPLNIASALAQHASELYSKNIFNFLELILKDGVLNLDFEDEIIKDTTLTHAGEIKNKAVYEKIKTPTA